MGKHTSKKNLTAIDLFCGCGGLSLGLRRAGFKIAAAVESDSKAANVYRRNHGQDVLIEHDICKISSRRLLRKAGARRGEVDLLAGCPPCQGFSALPRRNGRLKPDKRNALLDEFARHIKGIMPRAVLFENVPAVTRSSRFRSMIAELHRLKYNVRYGILNACDFGVPQRRRRLILIAVKEGAASLPVSKGGIATVRAAIGRLQSPGNTTDPLHRLVIRSREAMRELIANVPKNGGSRVDLADKFRLPCHKKIDGFKDVYGRMRWGKPSPTITSGCFNPSKGRFLHPEQNRAISMREAALLQSFPKNYRFPREFGITAIARLLGDALPPRFAEKQARHIRMLLENRTAS